MLIAGMAVTTGRAGGSRDGGSVCGTGLYKWLSQNWRRVDVDVVRGKPVSSRLRGFNPGTDMVVWDKQAAHL
jgi:hypothetical protein